MNCKFPLMIFISLALVYPSFSSGQELTTPDRAKQMFSDRHKNPALIDSSIALLSDYIQANPGNTAARILLSEIYLKKGNIETDNNKKLVLFTKGDEQALAALAQDSLNGRALMWEASNFSMICKTRGVMSSLANIPKIKERIARAIQLDPGYPKTYSVQGVIFKELPSVLGGNLDSARVYFEKGLALDANYSGIYVRLAEMSVQKKEYQKAREFLNKVLAMKNPTDRAEYEQVNKPDAAKLLEKIKDK